MLIATGALSWTVLLLPPLLLVQFTLMAGIAWIGSAANVFMRDVENVIGVLLTLTFYCTPIFYSIDSVPERYQTLLRLNPMTTMVESYRGVLMGTELPGARAARRGDGRRAPCWPASAGSCSAAPSPASWTSCDRRGRRPRGGLEVVSALRPGRAHAARVRRPPASGARRPGAALGAARRLAHRRARRGRRADRRQRRGQVDAAAACVRPRPAHERARRAPRPHGVGAEPRRRLRPDPERPRERPHGDAGRRLSAAARPSAGSTP